MGGACAAREPWAEDALRGTIAESLAGAALLSVLTHRPRPGHNADWGMSVSAERTNREANARWDTSSSSDDPVTLPPAFESLDGHSQGCKTANGNWFDLLCRIDGIQAFLGPRPISVVVAVLALTMVALWLWSPFP